MRYLPPFDAIFRRSVERPAVADKSRVDLSRQEFIRGLYTMISAVEVEATPGNNRIKCRMNRSRLVMAGAGPPSTTCLAAWGEVVNADPGRFAGAGLRQHTGEQWPCATDRFDNCWASPDEAWYARTHEGTGDAIKDDAAVAPLAETPVAALHAAVSNDAPDIAAEVLPVSGEPAPAATTEAGSVAGLVRTKGKPRDRRRSVTA